MEAALVVDRPCGEYSLPGVLCGGHRGVKHGYEPVAEELRHGAVMAMHLVQGASKNGAAPRGAPQVRAAQLYSSVALTFPARCHILELLFPL